MKDSFELEKLRKSNAAKSSKLNPYETAGLFSKLLFWYVYTNTLDGISIFRCACVDHSYKCIFFTGKQKKTET